MPDLIGQTPSGAGSALADAGLLGVEGTRVTDCGDIPPGRIVRQDPAAGASALVGSRVLYQVCELVVPPLADLSSSEAIAALQALELVPVLVEVPSSLPVGQVVATVPAAGTQVSIGDEINIQVSDGGLVPEVLGLSCEEATELLRNRGLDWRFEELPAADGDPGLVEEQQPPPGAQRPDDDVIVLHVNQSGECPAGTDGGSTGGTGGALVFAPVPTGPRLMLV